MVEKSKYQFDEASVQAIIHWAETTQLPKEVVLSESEHIYDTSLYVRANINDIKQHYPDEFYNPAITRLYRLKEFVEGRCVKMHTFFLLRTKLRLSQAGALLLPKDFVSLGIRISL